MIVGERKPMGEIIELVRPFGRILVLGCATCAAECMAGGERETKLLASALRLAFKGPHDDGRERTIRAAVAERQCEPDLLSGMVEEVESFETVLSLACGAGVQILSDLAPSPRILPGLNTKFLGARDEVGLWLAKCSACGECIVHLFDGICPVTRCSKSILNGPCGGSDGGKCEVSDDLDCAWDLIVKRLSERGRLDILERLVPPRDWSGGPAGGPGRVERKEWR